MALTDKQIAQRLLKKGQGVAETNFPLDIRGILEEGTPTYNTVTPNDIWLDASLIPTTPPTLSDGGESGVVKYFDKLELEQNDSGSNVAYKSPNGELKDAISGKFGFGYNFKIFSNDGNTQIFSGDWLVDSESGVLIFYDISNTEALVNPQNPPTIRFYKYIGRKGTGVDSNLAGSGLTFSNGQLNVVNGLSTSVGRGITFSNDLLEVNIDSESGLTFSGDVLRVDVGNILYDVTEQVFNGTSSVYTLIPERIIDDKSFFNVYINGVSINPDNIESSSSTFSFTGLPYTLDSEDIVVVKYNS